MVVYRLFLGGIKVCNPGTYMYVLRELNICLSISLLNVQQSPVPMQVH